MSNKSFGDISLRDYRRLTAARRPGWTKKLAGGVVGLMLVLACTAAGDYWGPWSGKGSRRLTYEQAGQLMQGSDWVQEIGLGSVFLHIHVAMEEMRKIAGKGGNAPDRPNYAREYLLNISVTGIRKLQALRDAAGADRQLYEERLERIRSELQN